MTPATFDCFLHPVPPTVASALAALKGPATEWVLEEAAGSRFEVELISMGPELGHGFVIRELSETKDAGVKAVEVTRGGGLPEGASAAEIEGFVANVGRLLSNLAVAREMSKLLHIDDETLPRVTKLPNGTEVGVQHEHPFNAGTKDRVAGVRIRMATADAMLVLGASEKELPDDLYAGVFTADERWCIEPIRSPNFRKSYAFDLSNVANGDGVHGSLAGHSFLPRTTVVVFQASERLPSLEALHPTETLVALSQGQKASVKQVWIVDWFDTVVATAPLLGRMMRANLGDAPTVTMSREAAEFALSVASVLSAVHRSMRASTELRKHIQVKSNIGGEAKGGGAAATMKAGRRR